MVTPIGNTSIDLPQNLLLIRASVGGREGGREGGGERKRKRKDGGREGVEEKERKEGDIVHT